SPALRSRASRRPSRQDGDPSAGPPRTSGSDRAAVRTPQHGTQSVQAEHAQEASTVIAASCALSGPTRRKAWEVGAGTPPWGASPRPPSGILAPSRGSGGRARDGPVSVVDVMTVAARLDPVLDGAGDETRAAQGGRDVDQVRPLLPSPEAFVHGAGEE